MSESPLTVTRDGATRDAIAGIFNVDNWRLL